MTYNNTKMNEVAREPAAGNRKIILSKRITWLETEDLGFRSHFFLEQKVVIVGWSGTPPQTRQVPLVGCHYFLLHPAMLDLSMRNALLAL